jgi:hypothetical protein
MLLLLLLLLLFNYYFNVLNQHLAEPITESEQGNTLNSEKQKNNAFINECNKTFWYTTMVTVENAVIIE